MLGTKLKGFSMPSYISAMEKLTTKDTSVQLVKKPVCICLSHSGVVTEHEYFPRRLQLKEGTFYFCVNKKSLTKV